MCPLSSGPKAGSLLWFSHTVVAMRQSPVTSKQVLTHSLKSPLLPLKVAPTSSSSHCSAQSTNLGTEGEHCQVPTSGSGQPEEGRGRISRNPLLQFLADQVKVRMLGEEDLRKAGNADVASFTNRF